MWVILISRIKFFERRIFLIALCNFKRIRISRILIFFFANGCFFYNLVGPFVLWLVKYVFLVIFVYKIRLLFIGSYG